MVGAVDGVNEHGLAIAYDYAFTTDLPQTPAAPLSMLISETLETCKTVDQAHANFSSRPRCGAALLMLADATGDIASLELSPTRSFLRRPAAGEDAIVHSNQFVSPSMREVQMPPEAVYNDRAPAPLRGRRLHESSDRRDARYRELLRGDEPLGLDDLGRIMADHGAAGVADDYTPCVHGSYWQTTACLQLLPASRTLRVDYANACQARQQEFSL